MQFNLIDERWIPVRRRDGSSDKIAPHEVTKGFDDNPIVSLDAPRPDFNGALIQFLIGLVQTTAAPDDEDDWEELLIAPPSPESLLERFMTVRDAFNLGGDGPRFMQDFEEISTKDSSIEGLLIESPGAHTTELNIDHFIKRNTVSRMCHCCCATALFGFQTNSPAGGPGYMTSLRGGGPLSTLVLGDSSYDSLWQFLFLNVLEKRKFENMCGNPTLTEKKHMFPWMGETRTGRRKKGHQFTGGYTTPEEVHPATMYWAMPRRIRLNLDNRTSSICDICGALSDRIIDSYKEIPGGASYGGAWLHPLTPYYEKTTKGETNILPVHAQPGGISYRHWLGLVLHDSRDNKTPARVVHEFINNRQRNDCQFRLWAFGYDMDKMKARCWYESTMPLLNIDHVIRQTFENCVAGMVRAASEIAMNTRSAVKKAWFKRPGDVRGDVSFVDNTFWQATESVFYDILHDLKSDLGAGGLGIKAGMVWHKELCNQALKLFDLHAWNGPVEDEDPKRIVDARKKLQQYNYGNKIKELLGLPFDKKSTDEKKPIARQKKS
ncbi:MAG: type I-E CRISPR-associated protein Cse1/CasA [Syntrophales bacterium]|jgi:CRISPR system Cascade subunit CasA|nr:type I-E CRISPR-associated protein Cse1/CasA [Syntrophales bacterium]MCK9391680.1 type I-E CRISPR-associated protein Cse1/CasA [Syntrophales bacterium]